MSRQRQLSYAEMELESQRVRLAETKYCIACHHIHRRQCGERDRWNEPCACDDPVGMDN